MPPVSAAIGMAAAYYGYPVFTMISPEQRLLTGLLFFSVVMVSFLRTLSLFPAGIGPAGKGAETPAFLSKAHILVVAAAVGFSLGAGSARSVPGPAEMGMEPERITAVSGVLREDPRSLHGSSGLAVLELRSCAGAGGLRASARGTLPVFFPAESIPRLKEFGRGCEIYTDGIYAAGIDAAGRGPSFRARSVHIVKSAPALEQFRTGLRMTLLGKFQSRRGQAPVWGGLASALLLGIRDDLDTELTEAFKSSGCAHVLALSGMHLAIISGVLAFFIRRPLGIRWASLIGAIFIVFYIFVAGSQPSLVRSGIMYLIAAFALWGLLKGKPLSLLSMAFIIQLIFQCETGVSLSFILSYLALAGILSLGETLRSLCRGRIPPILAGSLCSSLGAFIVTSPVVAYYFGSLKPVGIIAGLFIMPLCSLFMVLSLAALAAAFIPLPLWDLLDILLGWLYRFMELLAAQAGRVPGINVSDPVPVLVITVLLWLFVLFIQRRDMMYRNRIESFD